MVRFKVKPKRGTYKPHHKPRTENMERYPGRGGKKEWWRTEKEKKN